MNIIIKNVFALLSVMLLDGCSKPPEDEADGKQLYSYYCEGCHGAEGKGNFLSGIPANAMTKMSTSQIMKLINHGKQGDNNKKDMPAMPFLSDQQVKKVAQYLLRQLKPALKKSDTNKTLLLKP